MASNEKYTILYGRLSQEYTQKTNKTDDSNSIQNQKLLLEKYFALRHGRVGRRQFFYLLISLSLYLFILLLSFCFLLRKLFFFTTYTITQNISF